MLIALESENFRITKEEPESVTYKIESKYIPDTYLEIDLTEIDEVRELLEQAQNLMI